MENAIIATELKKFNLTDAALAEIQKKYMPLVINGIEDKHGYDLVHSARMDVKNKRVDVEKKRKELKEDSLKFGRAVDAEAKRITAQLEAVEKHLESTQRAIDTEKERIKKEAEERRKAILQARVDALQAVNGTILLSRLQTMTDANFKHVLQVATEEHNNAVEAENQRVAAEQERKRLLKEEEDIKAAIQSAALVALRKKEEEAATLLAEENAKLIKENLAIKARAEELQSLVDVKLSKNPERQLTQASEEDRSDFERSYGDGNCSCHISPPCGSCTHPGNPICQDENEECWEDTQQELVDAEFAEVEENPNKDKEYLLSLAQELRTFTETLMTPREFATTDAKYAFKNGLWYLSKAVALWEETSNSL